MCAAPLSCVGVSQHLFSYSVLPGSPAGVTLFYDMFVVQIGSQRFSPCNEYLLTILLCYGHESLIFIIAGFI